LSDQNGIKLKTNNRGTLETLQTHAPNNMPLITNGSMKKLKEKWKNFL
jgi:hypothetical protein